jgi:proteasome accessory factor C
VADGALHQLSRLLQILPVLADDKEHTLADVADKAGVDWKTLKSDLLVLSERLEDPGGFVETVQIFLEADRVSLISNAFRRPMRLTRSELCALELGLALLARQRPPDEQAVIERARARLRAVINKLPADWDPERTSYGELNSEADTRHIRELQLARQRRRKVRLGYRKAGARRAESRTVCPYALALASGRWYLIAQCEPRTGVRIFRLDRIESLETLDQGFAVPESFTPEQYLSEGRAFYAERPETLRVRYGPAIARWIAEREGRKPDADGSVTIDHPLADAEWAVRHVLQYGPEAEVLEPESVRKEIRARLAALLHGR